MFKKRKSRKYLMYCWLYTLHFGFISDSFKRELWDVKSVKLVNITVIIWLKVPTEEFRNSFQKEFFYPLPLRKCFYMSVISSVM